MAAFLRSGQARAVVPLLILSLLLAGAGTLVAADRATAAACLGGSCRGKWPGEQGCRDDQQWVAAAPVSQLDPDTGRGQIFYSPVCRAVWVEYQTNTRPQFLQFMLWEMPQYGGRPQALVRFHNAADPTFGGVTYTKVAGTTNIYRTVMTSWDSSIKACWHENFFTEYDPEGSNNGGQCSSWL